MSETCKFCGTVGSSNCASLEEACSRSNDKPYGCSWLSIEDQIRLQSASRETGTNEILTLLRTAYSDGFGQGMKEYSSSKGGENWSDRKEMYEAKLVALNALRAAGDAPAWQPIETAPKRDAEGCMVEIIIAGGTYIVSDGMYGEYEHKGWSLACFDNDYREFKFRGENSGAHDEFYYYKPTHWMPRDVLPPVPRPDRGGAA